MKTIGMKLADTVSELKITQDEGRQIELLQNINDTLLDNCLIRVNDHFIIEPLWVEAYYFHPKKFEDYNTHRKPQQQNNFCHLYIHPGFGGVDLCLSCGAYYLSFLLKYSRVDGGFTKQTRLGQHFRAKGIASDHSPEVELIYGSNGNQPIYHSIRKGLKKESYKKKLLAGVKELSVRENQFIFPKGFGKMRIVAQYLLDHPTENPEAQCEKLLKRKDLTKEIMKLYNDVKDSRRE